MDIANLEQSFLQGGLLDTIGRFVGGTPDATKKTFDAAIPTTMYAIADHGSSESGARSLLDGLRSGQAPQLDLASLGRTLGDPQASDQLMTLSGGFLEKMLGGKLSGLLGGLASFGGVNRSTAAKLIALAAPLALGVIGRHARDSKLDASGLASFLGDQKSKVASLVPRPLRQYLGLRQPRRVAEPAVARAPVAAEQRSRWPLLLLAIGAVLGLGWWLTLAFRTPQAPTIAAPTIRMPKPTVPAPALPAVQAPAVPAIEAGTLKPISDYLASGQSAPRRFNDDGLTFATGQSTLTADGRKSAGDLATILKAYPNATVRIEGFTDSTGAAADNQELSRARADAVKGALSADGVDVSRIQTAGMGEEKALGSNESSAGRAENRRVELLITPQTEQ